MSTVTIVLLVILVILIGVLIGLYFFGKKAQKKQTHAFCMERFRQLQDVKMHLQLVLLHIWIRFQIIVTMI